MVLLIALAASVSGCSAINETLVQDLHWIWFLPSALMAGVIAVLFRWQAWREALKEWEPPGALNPGVTRWGKGWIPLLLVGAIFVWFTAYNFLATLPMPPDQPWWNAGAWLLGSAGGVLAGWFGGRKVASVEFEKRFPVQSLPGPSNEGE